ncbi:hypothetical protein SJ05684_b44150 (plasmid) [Sinorhizobium sojae CCBAU 05684]|uniref:Uncharacterized protein n=1 Tax=Sinorhizobium sojae CCBAU 05684 TaxID=716928 RepID=A0A249PI24_9HYPH|nr:hypothetical protein SJ05684_b44150 [Sinorhizobium sojae CCBAU 05684]
MPGIKAQARKIGRDILDDTSKLVGEFDIASGMGVDGRAHAILSRANSAIARILPIIPAQASASRRGARSEWPAA